jgi:2-amino-4-hydroxy-6-hydroxymethyldihydropteridine diphosphokinase
MLAAKRLLAEFFSDSGIRASHLYRTPPVGGPKGQSDFLNAVVSIEHDKSVWEVWDAIKRIEKELGRQRQHRWESRRIDIDVLLHDQDCIWTPHFKVPHPRMCMRSFILKPAMEIATDWIDPVSRMSMSQLLESLESKNGILIVSDRPEQEAKMQAAVRSSALEPRLKWLTLDSLHPNDIDRPKFSWPRRLLVVGIATPDPETIQWEDFTRSWAQSLGMDKTSNGLHLPIGPRYLLPTNDLDWARHEIQAAFDAMDCPVEIAFPFD